MTGRSGRPGLALGGWVVLDPAVLTANPVLWHRLEQGVRRSRERGALRCGAAPARTAPARHRSGPGSAGDPAPGPAGGPRPESVRDPGPPPQRPEGAA
ncbi:hypothetical protein STRMOE7_13235 [Streptomyces sp. MOE7]|nr:hypothetical protein STRMOE7_13235 [Streptomyces sp. MOE7]